jgi:polyphosphate kinase
VGEDVTDLFNHLTGYSRQDSYQQLLVAPESLRAGLVGRIAHQTDRQRAGKSARIQFKCNALIDEVVVDALYRASQAGVPIDLWVRGICTLRPGVPGLSETVRVRSILGRFLEHSRVYAFGTGEDGEADPDARGEVWLGSPDMMHRNLDRRVETIVRVTDRGHAQELRRLLELGMSDETASWWLDADGTWTRRDRGPHGERLRDIQALLIGDRRLRAADG